jgi:uncharacterized paraquat-inducible protein A
LLVIGVIVSVPQLSADGLVLWLFLLFVACLYCAVLARVTKSYLRKRTHVQNTCENCDYPIVHLPEARCPECGTPFRPEKADVDAFHELYGGPRPAPQIDGQPKLHMS